MTGVLSAITAFLSLCQFTFSLERSGLDAGLNDIVNYIRTVGPRKFRYYLDIEIRNHRTPRTWTERLMSRPSLGRA